MSTTTRPRIIRSIRPNVTRNPLSESWRRRLPLLPALLIMIVLTQVPFVMSVYYSLTDWRVVPPEPRNWVGLENYKNLFDNQFFKDAAVVSI
jgi:sorbitol/mannitol transport system permease protein